MKRSDPAASERSMRIPGLSTGAGSSTAVTSPRRPRPPSRDVRGKSVWLGMETRHPDRHTYTFERIQELPLGR